MKTIDVADDIHSFLLSRMQDFNETASDVLRRELGLTHNKPPAKQESKHELSSVLAGTKMMFHLSTKDSYLYVLGEAYKDRPQAFESLLKLGGRERRYFGRTEAEIANSGRSTHPKQIPGSPYWAMTNASNEYKGKILRDALLALGYSASAAEAARTAIS